MNAPHKPLTRDDLNLPEWARAERPLQLILAILEERPDCSNYRSDWGHRVLRYNGHFAPKLRRYYSDLTAAAIARSTEEFVALNSQEQPDELIDRLMNADLSVKSLGNGIWRVEA